MQKLVSNVPDGQGAQVEVATPSQEETQRRTDVHGGGPGMGTVGGGSPHVLQLPPATMAMMIRAMITPSA